MIEDLDADFSAADRQLADFWADAVAADLAARLRRDGELTLRFPTRDAAGRLYPDHPAPQQFVRAYIVAVGRRLLAGFPDMRTRCVLRPSQRDHDGASDLLVIAIGLPDGEDIP